MLVFICGYYGDGDGAGLPWHMPTIGALPGGSKQTDIHGNFFQGVCLCGAFVSFAWNYMGISLVFGFCGRLNGGFLFSVFGT